MTSRKHTVVFSLQYPDLVSAHRVAGVCGMRLGHILSLATKGSLDPIATTVLAELGPHKADAATQPMNKVECMSYADNDLVTGDYARASNQPKN